MVSTRLVEWRMISTSTLAWSRSSWASSSAGDRKDAPAFTEVRSRSIERNGLGRALTTTPGSTQRLTVETSAASKVKSNRTS